MKNDWIWTIFFPFSSFFARVYRLIARTRSHSFLLNIKRLLFVITDRLHSPRYNLDPINYQKWGYLDRYHPQMDRYQLVGDRGHGWRQDRGIMARITEVWGVLCSDTQLSAWSWNWPVVLGVSGEFVGGFAELWVVFCLDVSSFCGLRGSVGG